MESKLKRDERRVCHQCSAFNRTSMESKHGSLICWYGSRIPLLIEPVWNRNSLPQAQADFVNDAFNRTSMESKPKSFRPTVFRVPLLIEPVWNRNSSESGVVIIILFLLIEPVWNRN